MRKFRLRSITERDALQFRVGTLAARYAAGFPHVSALPTAYEVGLGYERAAQGNGFNFALVQPLL